MCCLHALHVTNAIMWFVKSIIWCRKKVYDLSKNHAALHDVAVLVIQLKLWERIRVDKRQDEPCKINFSQGRIFEMLDITVNWIYTE